MKQYLVLCTFNYASIILEKMLCSHSFLTIWGWDLCPSVLPPECTGFAWPFIWSVTWGMVYLCTNVYLNKCIFHFDILIWKVNTQINPFQFSLCNICDHVFLDLSIIYQFLIKYIFIPAAFDVLPRFVLLYIYACQCSPCLIVSSNQTWAKY